MPSTIRPEFTGTIVHGPSPPEVACLLKYQPHFAGQMFWISEWEPEGQPDIWCPWRDATKRWIIRPLWSST